MKHLILFYFMCALVLNLFQIEMKMYCAGHSGHSLKKRVEFKHRFWCLTLVQFRFFFFGRRMKVKGGQSRRIAVSTNNEKNNDNRNYNS